jgi:hypothetical protein
MHVKKLVTLKDLPECFGDCKLVCINKCEVWESCIRRIYERLGRQVNAKETGWKPSKKK